MEKALAFLLPLNETVLDPSAVKCVQAAPICGYCKLCTGYFEPQPISLNTAAENQLSGALGRLFALAENYPQLKANQNYLALQEELTSTENKISFARQYYNDEVNRLNAAVQSFPSNIIAAQFGFKNAEFFEVEVPEERQAPQVKF